MTLPLGPSGAGKTTLLNSISGQLTPTSGEVTIISSAKQINFAFVPQTVSLILFFTVKETLMFASKMKNGHMSKQEHNQKIDSLVATFSMLDKLNDKVMNLSGGQRRRLSIMIEGEST